MTPGQVVAWAGVVFLCASVALFVFMVGWFVLTVVRGKR